MKREIKFRAWDESKKELRDVTAINWYDEYMWVDETPMSGDKLPIEGTPLMQYTGIRDSKNKEIYEGDIVLWGVNQGIVEMKNGSWMVTDLLGLDSQFEIIGNIYEHKNLIERQNTEVS